MNTDVEMEIKKEKTVDLELLSQARFFESQDLSDFTNGEPRPPHHGAQAHSCTHAHDTSVGETPHDHNSSHHDSCACSVTLSFSAEPHDDEEEGGGKFWDWTVLALGGVALLLGLFPAFSLPSLKNHVFYTLVWLLCGWPVLSAALNSLRRGRGWEKFFNEFTLMAGASFAALCLGEAVEALAVMLFYQAGELLQERAAGRSRRSIKALLAVKPTTAHILEDGGLRDELPEAVEKGMRVLVRPGEKIPVDGIVREGTAYVDTSSITGESVPVSASSGSKVYGGTLCLDGALQVEATGPFKDSEIARVLELVERAAANKSPVERFITKFAAIYTPLVFALALLTFAVPPLLGWGPAREWLYRALVVLMVSCPCALVISVPLSYFGGIGAAARQGILIKGGSVLDALNEISSVGFDKTGTLTEGVFEVSELNPADGATLEELKEAARTAESLSQHPLARSIRAELGSLPPEGLETKELPGRGVLTHYKGERYLAGSPELMAEHGLSLPAFEPRPGLVLIARGERFLGSLLLSDRLRDDAPAAVSQLQRYGLKCFLLTGDSEESARPVAKALKMDAYRAGLLPEMKVQALTELAQGRRTAFVGDGVNDAPLLASAHVGIAMGGLGSDVAIEAADAVLLTDSPSRVINLMDVARRTRSIVRQNVGGSLAVKALFLGLGFLGLAGLWEAIFADVGVAFLAVLNSARQLKGISPQNSQKIQPEA
ncbi:MAG: cadmium-translocating P-type ATPase [Fretibacterium sp.]|nr:cadmium-translocating P-type ATPase [Fretibacterium sp.]